MVSVRGRLAAGAKEKRVSIKGILFFLPLNPLKGTFYGAIFYIVVVKRNPLTARVAIRQLAESPSSQKVQYRNNTLAHFALIFVNLAVNGFLFIKIQQINICPVIA